MLADLPDMQPIQYSRNDRDLWLQRLAARKSSLERYQEQNWDADVNVLNNLRSEVTQAINKVAKFEKQILDYIIYCELRDEGEAIVQTAAATARAFLSFRRQTAKLMSDLVCMDE